jgi:hypothetical protein
MEKVAIICLGAFGDCCNALPLALHEFQQDNNVTFYISREFESLLDGVTYCEKAVVDTHYSNCLPVAEEAERTGKYDRVMIVQCYGTPIERHTDSFCKEAWRAVGKLHLWGKLPLAFDNRDKRREHETFVDTLDINPDAPILLVSTSGKSSPFPFSKQLLELIEPLKEKFRILDISNIRCARFYDLLGLMEMATCAIFTDSGPLHLANAVPKLPVVALITDSPDMWHGSPRQENHIARIRYRDFMTAHGSSAILAAVLSTVDSVATKKDVALFHIWNDYDRSDDGNIHRHHLAKQTWEKVYRSNPNWVPYPVHLKQLTRNSIEIGEVRCTPYFKDAINLAAADADQKDILVFTNDDGLLLDGFTNLILRTLSDRPAMWCPRWELPLNAEPKWGTSNGYKHCGADVFAFTKKWWTDNESNFPDHLISFEAWDLNFRMLIEMTGGIKVEGAVAHYIHQPVWHSSEHREGPGNLHNRKLFQKWLAQRNMNWPSVT